MSENEKMDETMTSIEQLEKEKKELLEMQKYLKRTKYLNYGIPVAIVLMFNSLLFAAAIEKDNMNEKIVEYIENDIGMIEIGILEAYFALLGISAFKVANQENKSIMEATESSIKLREKIIESKKRIKENNKRVIK